MAPDSQPLHEQLAPYGWLRERARGGYLDLLRKALATDDGRDILCESMRGLDGRRPAVDPQTLGERVYPDLGVSRHVSPKRQSVFITARFRSGSTLLWNLLRHVPECTSYYEPLNERRWFDPSERGTRVDGTHKGVDDYWREYEGLEHLGPVFRDEWNSRNLYMDATFEDDDLRTYIDRLIAHATSCAVLQFNRTDFRLPWLKQHYPETPIVHLYRHPRDQWCSSLVDPARVPLDVKTADFAAFDHFYLLAWARDLKHVFPFLAPEREAHPYRLFYLIWKLSYVFGRMYADHSISFEHLTTTPAAAIRDLLAACRLDQNLAESLVGLVEPGPVGRWRAYATGDWFEGHESACESILLEALGDHSRIPQVLNRT